MSPTQRTLAECRRRGWLAEVVERWNPHSRTRKDLFGCIDVVAVAHTEPNWTKHGLIIGIQACASASHAARVAKALEQHGLACWKDAGGCFAVWSWSKRITRKKDGTKSRTRRWTLREEWL